MKLTPLNAPKLLSTLANRFETEQQLLKLECLKQCSKLPLLNGKALLQYHEVLLFLISHPQSEEVLRLAEKELQRLTRFLHSSKNKQPHYYLNSGLPFTAIETYFSHDCISWMLQSGSHRLRIAAFEEGGAAPGSVLKLCLPSTERELTTYGYDNQTFFKALGLKTDQVLPFLIERLATLNQQPLLKDYLFDSLQINLNVSSKNQNFSRTYNRFLKSPVFFHQEILKRFDHHQLLNQPLPAPAKLSQYDRATLITVIKNSLVLTARETDPATYLEESSLRFYQLERGIAIAIYTMEAARQLPFESYVGFTLFKNGFPAAYGGAWIFAKRALFGMNIFESFRGGESGFMMCELLRVYRQVFQLDAIEVEPYQFGKDNPDGIASGAFWFYYRYGFRPVDRALRTLAEKEHQKIKATKGYHSSYETLEKFTDSFICLEWNKTRQKKVSDWTSAITRFISKEFQGHRGNAESAAIAAFCAKTKIGKSMPGNALAEYALLTAALKISDEPTLALLSKLVIQKPADLYGYQQTLQQLMQKL